MNYPAASSGVSNEDPICLIAASDEVLDLALRNKSTVKTCLNNSHSPLFKIETFFYKF